MINILSQQTVNKIAAGEVVERPLNAVKEIVENSLDACASSITVEILEAGKKLIRVSDNGYGMDKKDLELSVLRHATSKISDFNDLYHIQSLGFRGEALSSIAAVSDFEIKTRKKGESSGWQLSAKGGIKPEVSPWAGSEGTVTEVKDLFFNTPARKKFLKSDATERSKIIDSLEETALANYDIAFKLISEKKIVFSAAKANAKIERISDILGIQFASTLKNINGEHSKILFDVYFTGRDDSLSNRKYQYFFVNSRPVNFPKWLSHCVYLAYKESIPVDKYPGILIYITIDPSEIDVNIHPTKREVKFSDETAVYDILYKSIKSALTSHSYSSLIKQSKDTASSYIDEAAPVILSEAKNPAVSSSSSRQSTPIYLKEPKPHYTPKNYNINQYASVFAKQEEFKTGSFDGNIKVLGQVFDTYVIAENDGQLYIFDQHAAAERVRYEFYMAQLEKQNLKIQQILIPENFEISPSLSDLLKSNLNLFNELGISIEEFGKNSFRITAYPALLGNISIEHIVKAVLGDIDAEKSAEIEQKREKIIRFACRASIKAGDSVASLEAKKLINDLFKCQHPFTCPHGRPTAYKISKDELEKFFKRK
ncbi:MAG: DNA mismatch repair endonuclease MutL [Endomicrobia bacterium]|nr:DNA mismatch repair endonuclease MutL [Endomicrobiia bacterium]